MNPVRNIKQNSNKELDLQWCISNGVKLTSIRGVKNLLRKYHLRPLKRMGQNFLIDEGGIKKIIESAQLSKNDIVLEIGPGIGNLTIELAKKVKEVIAVEKDPKMCQILKEMLDCWNLKNVEIVNEDILKLDTRYKIQDTRYKVVANLPFYLTAPVIRKFLEEKYQHPRLINQPRVLVLMVQKEVGQRICAKPPDMSILAVSVQFYAKPEIISYISKKSFWPSPQVDSAIIKIIPRKSALLSASIRFYFFKIVKAGFSQPRKQLINNLSRLRQDFGGQAKKIDREKIKDWLLKNNIRPNQRAETLTVENWLSLTKNFHCIVK